MEAISILITLDSADWRLEGSFRHVICKNFVRKYMGNYPLNSYCYLTIRLNDKGLIWFKKYPGEGWAWTFNKFPKGSMNDWDCDDNNKHSLYIKLTELLSELSYSNNEITDFRAEVYMTDVDYSDDLKKELYEEESLKLIGETF